MTPDQYSEWLAQGGLEAEKLAIDELIDALERVIELAKRGIFSEIDVRDELRRLACS